MIQRNLALNMNFDVSPEQQRQMEEVLKVIGRRAEELGKREGHR